MDMFSTRTMMAMVEEGRTSNHTWLRDRYFGTRPTFDTQYIEFDVVDMTGRKLAPFVDPKASGAVLGRKGYKTQAFVAPEVSPYRVTTAEDLLKRSAGETVYSTLTPMQRAAQLLGKDLADLDEIISRREEAMCAEALFTGKISIAGAGLSANEISYWSTLASADQPKTTLTTKWDASATKAAAIMKDLRDARRSMNKRGGFTPTELICGTKVIDTLLDKFTGSNAFDMRRVDMGAIDPQHLPNGVSYWGYLKDSALDIYSYDEWYLNDNGTEVAMVPENLCLLASPNVRTMLAYGAVGVVDESSPNGISVYAGARVPASWVQHANPTGRILQMKSRPLPIIQQIYGFHVLDTLTATAS